MSIGNAIFQGIVQGLTEFLPISSSGHLSLIQYFTGQGADNGVLFTVLLHLGTLLAVIMAFWKTIAQLIFEFCACVVDIFHRRFSLKRMPGRRRMLVLLIVALLPMVFAVLFKDWFESLSADDSILEEGLCFLLTSALLFWAERSGGGNKNAKSMSYVDALAVGGMQALAPLPGLSRSGSTIAVGLLRGLDRRYAVAFSFILGIPAVLGANLLELRGVAEEGLSIPIPALIWGLVFSLASGILAIRLVKWLVASEKLRVFAWYTLALGLVTVLVAVVEIRTGHMLQRLVMGT